MNQRQQLLLCRLGLIVFCVLPTVLVGGWCAAAWWEDCHRARAADWQRDLSRSLGLNAELDTLHHLPGGAVELHGVRLSAPDTGRLVASAGVVTVAAAPGGWQVALEQPAIEQGQLGRLARLLAGRTIVGIAAPGEASQDVHMRCAAPAILIGSQVADQTLTQFSGEFIRDKQQVRLQCSFRLPGMDSDQAGLIHITAARESGPGLATLEWRLDTGGAAFPLALATEIAPALARLGAEAQFRGTAQFTGAPDGWSGGLAGVLTDVDLDALVSEQFPHRLSGRANVRIEHATFAAGKLAEIRGVIEAANGSVSRSLVAAAAEHLQLAAAERILTGSSEAVGFRRLAIGFQLTGVALCIAGQADPANEGVLVMNAAGPVLTAAHSHEVPAVNLLRTLLPGSLCQVPATRQTAALVGLLPLPDAPTGDSERPAAHVPTRLGPAASTATQPAVQQPVLR